MWKIVELAEASVLYILVAEQPTQPKDGIKYILA